MPIGWTDVQDGGSYRLQRRDDDALFGYAVGQHSWKKMLFPPRTELFRAERSNGSLRFMPSDVPEVRYAFLGVRACELAAMAIQDRVFLGSGTVDRTYETARRDVFTVAVNCIVAGGTCFCVSMGTGPRCTDGYDMVLTEVIDDDRHEFVLESGTQSRGGPPRLDYRDDPAPTPTSTKWTASSPEPPRKWEGRWTTPESRSSSTRTSSTRGGTTSPQRCLACTNCTLVCPTCFCSTTEDSVSLDGAVATRSRRWDSCFTLDFSGVHGVPVRSTTKERYRQWMTHKLASWYDQFGSSGCVGCGRCITWCPVGIDITQEVAAIRATQRATA